jgi:hypothetical protein
MFRRWVLRATLLGLAVRLVHLLAVAATPIPRWQSFTTEGDFATTWNWAAQIRGGDFLGRPPYHPYSRWMQRMGTPADWDRWWGGALRFQHAPLYAYVIAAFSRAPDGTALPVFVLQLVLGVLCIPLVAFLARRWAGEKAGIVAAFLWALGRSQIALESFLLRDALGLPLALGGLCLMELLRDRGPRWKWCALGAGALFGVGTLQRENVLLLGLTAVPMAAWLIRGQHTNLRPASDGPEPELRRVSPFLAAALVLAGFAAMLSPLVARNVAVGVPALNLSNRAPEVLLECLEVAPGADYKASIYPALGPRLEEAHASVWRTLGIILRDGAQKPGAFARFLLVKAWAWLSAAEIPDNLDLPYLIAHSPLLYGSVAIWLLLGPALLGLWLLRKNAMVLWSAALFGGPLMIAPVVWRLRAGILPVVVPLAAAAFVWLWKKPLALAPLAAFAALQFFAAPQPVGLLRPIGATLSAKVFVAEQNPQAALAEIDAYLAEVSKGRAAPYASLSRYRDEIAASLSSVPAR